MITMSITRALAEVKNIDKQMSRKIRNLELVAFKEAGGKFDSEGLNVSIEEFDKRETAALQSVEALIDNKLKLKKAIDKANLDTMVELGGKQMSIQEAIRFKNDVIVHKKSLLSRLQEVLLHAKSTVNRRNDEVDFKIQEVVRKFESDTKKGDKTDAKDFSELIQAHQKMLEQQKYTVHDPIGIENKISTLQEEIETFEKNVDFVLSEANTATTIEVDID